jgi:hypothetical protein
VLLLEPTRPGDHLLLRELLPPKPHNGDDLIVDDVSKLNLASERVACLVGSVPLAAP